MRVEPRGWVALVDECGQPEGMNHMTEPMLQGKTHDIPKRLVWDAWLKVKENKGAAGADGMTIGRFEADLRGSLYKLWNRMSSGSYFPRSEEHTSELQSHLNLVCRLLLEKKKNKRITQLGTPTP